MFITHSNPWLNTQFNIKSKVNSYLCPVPICCMILVVEWQPLTRQYSYIKQRFVRNLHTRSNYGRSFFTLPTLDAWLFGFWFGVLAPGSTQKKMQAHVNHFTTNNFTPFHVPKPYVCIILPVWNVDGLSCDWMHKVGSKCLPFHDQQICIFLLWSKERSQPQS